jgi:hypothetical protein
VDDQREAIVLDAVGGDLVHVRRGEARQ